MQQAIQLTAREIATWLGVSVQEAEELMARRIREGRWHVPLEDGQAGQGRVEMTAREMNAEIDRVEDLRAEPSAAAAAAVSVERLRMDLSLAQLRNEELKHLLSAAKRALEEIQERHEAVKAENAELSAMRSRNEELQAQLLELKGQLVASFDRTLAVQQELLDARAKTQAKVDAAELDIALSILERLKSRANSSS